MTTDPALLLKELIDQSRKVEAQKLELDNMKKAYEKVRQKHKELKKVTGERNDQYQLYK